MSYLHADPVIAAMRLGDREERFTRRRIECFDHAYDDFMRAAMSSANEHVTTFTERAGPADATVVSVVAAMCEESPILLATMLHVIRDACKAGNSQAQDLLITLAERHAREQTEERSEAGAL